MRREVLVAVRVDLGRAHHHVAAARPHDVEHRPVRVPRLDDLGASSAPTGASSATSSASPSVMTRSGSKVARARRPPIIGMVPIGLARISPSPRKHSATATTQTSARVGVASSSAHSSTRPSLVARPRRGRATSARNAAHASAIFAPTRRTRAGRPRRARSRARTTVKCAPFGASTTPSTMSRLMRSGVDATLPSASSSVGTIRSTHMNRPSRPPAEQVVEVEVGSEELAVAAGVAAVQVARARRRGRARARRRALSPSSYGRRRTVRSSVVEPSTRPSRARPGSAGTAPATPRPAGRAGTCPSSSSASSTAPAWRAVRKCGSSGIESSDTNAYTTCLHLARPRTAGRRRARRSSRP